MDVSEEHLKKALAPIVATESGSMIDASKGHPAKVFSLTVVGVATT
jgi:hypothetical protein